MVKILLSKTNNGRNDEENFDFCGVFPACRQFPANAWSYGEFISCNALNPMPAVTFKTSYGQLVHDFNLSTDEITAKASGAEKGFFVDGLARVGTRSSFRLRRYTVRRLDAGATCVLPAEVEFFFGFKEPEIYVSKDLDKDSCRFSVVIRHEQVHQRINKLVLEYFLPLISDELQKAVRDVKAVKVSSPEQGEDGAEELMKYYQARLGPLITTFEKVLEKEQDKLDNLTNYQMEWELCRKYESEHPAEQTE